MTITVEFTGDGFSLMCEDGRMGVMPAGARLFKRPPFPSIEFNHAEFEPATRDAAKLQTYVNQLDDRQPSKSDYRRHVE